MSSFTWPARVYYEDTDAGGIVYYANYLRFLERARTEWLRSLGFHQRELAQDPGIVFAVVSISVDYLRPARLDDELLVTCAAHQVRAAAVYFDQRIYRRSANGQTAGGASAAAAATGGVITLPPEDLLIEARVRVACLDAQGMRPTRMPDELINALSAKE